MIGTNRVPERKQERNMAYCETQVLKSIKGKLVYSGKEAPANEVTRLNIFDFDNTLFMTPEGEEGARMYFERTGKAWPFGDKWSGRAETLLPPMESKPGPALPDFLREIKRPEAHTWILTSRDKNCSGGVEYVLDTVAGVRFFRLILYKHGANTTGAGGRGKMMRLHPDSGEKMLKIEAMLHLLPRVNEVHVWEDRPHVAAEFAAMRLPPRARLFVYLAGPGGCRLFGQPSPSPSSSSSSASAPGAGGAAGPAQQGSSSSPSAGAAHPEGPEPDIDVGTRGAKRTRTELEEEAEPSGGVGVSGAATSTAAKPAPAAPRFERCS
eukprot:tig00021179_g19249.t1